MNGDIKSKELVEKMSIGVDVASGKDQTVKILVIIDETSGVPETQWFESTIDLPIITIQPHPFTTRISNEWDIPVHSEDSDTLIIVEAK